MRALAVVAAALLALGPPAVFADGFFDLLNPANKKPIQEEFFGGDPLAKDKLAILGLKGVIMSNHAPGGMDVVETLRAQLAYAGKDADLKGILLEIDSPGGGVTDSDILCKAVEAVRARGKKVVVLMEDLAASGGYFVAAAADRILAHPSTITGSIGVIMKTINVESLYDKIGLKDVTLKSSSTPLKDMLSSTRPMSEEEKKIMQGLLDQMYDRFVDVVAKGRKMPMDKARKLADGRIYSAKEAVDAGLVDAVGFREDALAELKKLCGITKEPKLVKFRKTFNLQDFLGGGLGGTLGGDVTGRVVERLLTESRTPRFLYLWEP